MDPSFYIAAAVFALALFFLVFSIRKYLGIKNRSDFEDIPDEPGAIQAELPLSGPAADERGGAGSPLLSGVPSRAEEFVKGLYDSLASLDGRVKHIETELSTARINRDFTVKFLEDMVSDFDSLDKTKIKSRIEFLLADLKK